MNSAESNSRRGRSPQGWRMPCAIAVACALAAATLVSGCDEGNRSPDPPVGPHPLGESYGKLYDEAAYKACYDKDPWNGRCELHILKRNPNPEFWPYPDAPPFKWPDPPRESVYRPGMTAVEYFNALCAAEAGEFIYETVQAPGIYEIRPRAHEIDYAMVDRYVVEDPYGNNLGEDEEWIPFTFVFPPELVAERLGYAFFETPWREGMQRMEFDESLGTPQPPDRTYRRYFGYDKKDWRSMRMEWVDRPASAYGFVWRGLSRPMARELGIGGGELAVVDLRTSRILGLRRGFLLGGALPKGAISWHGGRSCPQNAAQPHETVVPMQYRDYGFGLWFIRKVVVPVNEADSNG
jgi:hypothetical protein